MNTKDTAMLNDQDKGTALLAWYELAIRDYPEGLVTQAQAAKMLNISRTAVSRLVSRGHLRAVYFPKPPEVEGIPVGNDDPFWLKLMAVLEPMMGTNYERRIIWPEASFVSFADVKRLWADAGLADKCHYDWLGKFGVSKPKGTQKQGKRNE
jgi:hypothetical protein